MYDFSKIERCHTTLTGRGGVSLWLCKRPIDELQICWLQSPSGPQTCHSWYTLKVYHRNLSLYCPLKLNVWLNSRPFFYSWSNLLYTYVSRAFLYEWTHSIFTPVPTKSRQSLITFVCRVYSSTLAYFLSFRNPLNLLLNHAFWKKAIVNILKYDVIVSNCWIIEVIQCRQFLSNVLG